MEVRCLADRGNGWVLITQRCHPVLTPVTSVLWKSLFPSGRLQVGLLWWKTEGGELHKPRRSPDFSL